MTNHSPTETCDQTQDFIVPPMIGNANGGKVDGYLQGSVRGYEFQILDQSSDVEPEVQQSSNPIKRVISHLEKISWRYHFRWLVDFF